MYSPISFLVPLTKPRQLVWRIIHTIYVNKSEYVHSLELTYTYIYTFIYIVSKNMQYKRMCVWENSSAASKEKNRIFNISQLSNTTLHTDRVFNNTSVVTVTWRNLETNENAS